MLQSDPYDLWNRSVRGIANITLMEQLFGQQSPILWRRITFDLNEQGSRIEWNSISTVKLLPAWIIQTQHR